MVEGSSRDSYRNRRWSTEFVTRLIYSRKKLRSNRNLRTAGGDRKTRATYEATEANAKTVF